MAHVLLVEPCYQSVLRPDESGHAIRLLKALGDEVTLLRGRCCGQPAYNSGFRDDARATGREMLRAARDADAVVMPSGSCTSMVQHYLPTLFGGRSRDEATVIAGRFTEISAWVAAHEGLGKLALRLKGSVVYHDSCHYRRELGQTDIALALLSRVEGLQVRRLAHEDECCGFGGTFSAKMPAVSTAMLRAKLADIAASGARVAVSADLSCLAHIGAGADGTGQPLETWSITELLARALP
jgi:L-lactate dehydrogenase complex protein LldE